MVQGLIAGGQKAMTVAVEGAEDSKELGRQDLVDLKLSANDIVVGIAASGRTPYVIGGLEYATTVEQLPQLWHVIKMPKLVNMRKCRLK